MSFFFETFPPVSKMSIYGKSRALRKNTRGEGDITRPGRTDLQRFSGGCL